MKKRKKVLLKKLNNKGSAIVSVIVVVAFVSILATTILYVSGMNYYMKMTDLKTKESFYSAETALEEIKAALVKEVSTASEEAYTEVMINYAASDGFTRYAKFQDVFLDTLNDNWTAKTVNPGDPSNPLTYEKVIQDIVLPGMPMPTGTEVLLTLTDPSLGLELHEAEGYALLKGVNLQYKDADGFTTMISTDFIIRVPELNWGIDSSKTSYNEGDSVEHSKVDMSEYVQYYNWIKK